MWLSLRKPALFFPRIRLLFAERVTYVVCYQFNDLLKKKNRVRCMVRGTFRVRELRVEVRHRCVMKVGTYKVH